MEKNIDKFFQTAEKDDSLKEKYNQIKNQKNKTDSLFFSSATKEEEEIFNIMKLTTINEILLSEKKRWSFKFWVKISFLVILCSILIFLYAPSGDLSAKFLLFCVLAIVVLILLGCFFFKLEHCQEVEMIRLYCLNDPIMNKIFLTYFYSPSSVADKKYIKLLLSENEGCIEKTKKFDRILRNKKRITYVELNNIFGLTSKEKHMVAKLYAQIVDEEMTKRNISNFSKETLSFLN